MVTMPDVTFAYHGHNAPDVRQLLLARKRAGYQSGTSNDGHRLALVFEGGAMRGLISCAAGARLQELGFGGCFDLVYGTSAGAISAAYFVAGQAEVAMQIYLTDILTKEFMHLYRWPDQVDVHWLAENVVATGPRKLDLQAVMSAAAHLQIPATEIETGTCRFFSNKSDPAEFLVPSLAASGSPPLLVSHRTPIDGMHYNDGMMRSPVSSQKAIEDGATDVIALLCNPVGRRKRPRPFRGFIEQLIRIRHYPAEFQAVFHARTAFYNDAMAAIHTPPQGVNTLALCPDRTDPVPRMLEKDTAILNTVVQCQFERIDAIFGPDAASPIFRIMEPDDVYYS